jgi:hypothetical protein
MKNGRNQCFPRLLVSFFSLSAIIMAAAVISEKTTIIQGVDVSSVCAVDRSKSALGILTVCQGDAAAAKFAVKPH